MPNSCVKIPIKNTAGCRLHIAVCLYSAVFKILKGGEKAMAITFNRLSSIYVSKDMNSQYSPVFASIEDALSFVADMRKNGAYQPVSVRLTDCEYDFSSVIEIDESVCDLTIEPDSGEALISGGRKITGFQKDIFNSKECFSAYVPEIKSGEWRFTDLYVDGLRAKSTRYPETGFLHALEVENKGGNLFDSSKWFIADKNDLSPISDINDCIISFCHYWIDEHTPVERYDPDTGKLIFKYASRFGITTEFSGAGTFKYYIENSRVTFGNPNEWYVDYSDGKVYYVPRSPDMTADSITVYAPVTSQLFTVKGTPDKKVSGIRFKNLNFAYTRGDYASTSGVQGKTQGIGYASDAQAVSNAHGSITFENAHSCSVENCSIKNFGVHAINIKEGCDRIFIIGNEIFDGGAGGVRICGAPFSTPSGGDKNLFTKNNVISNNTIKTCGRRYMAACGVLIMHSYGNTVSHNEICDLYYTGVSCGWVWGYSDSITRDNVITKNHIHHLGQGALSDMGGVYLLGKQRGTVVSNNIIHDVTSNTYGGWALYTDEGSSYITLENNICYNVSNNCYHQHYGSFNTVRNNIFALSKDEVMRVSRFEEHLCIIFEHNIIYSDGSKIYGFDEKHITEGTVGSSGNIVFDRKNQTPLFYERGSVGKLNLDEIQKYGMELGTVVTDPKFRNPDEFDFSLCDDSPAFKLGFKKINTSDVGPV